MLNAFLPHLLCLVVSLHVLQFASDNCNWHRLHLTSSNARWQREREGREVLDAVLGCWDQPGRKEHKNRGRVGKRAYFGQMFDTVDHLIIIKYNQANAVRKLPILHGYYVACKIIDWTLVKRLCKMCVSICCSDRHFIHLHSLQHVKFYVAVVPCQPCPIQSTEL